MAGSISAHFILRNNVDSMILLRVVINALNMFDQPESTQSFPTLLCCLYSGDQNRANYLGVGGVGGISWP